MIGRILAWAGIGDEEAIINAAHPLGDNSFGGERPHPVAPTSGDGMSLTRPSTEPEPVADAARRAILSKFVGAVAQLERVEAMAAKGLRPEADSLARVIADLHWEYRKLGGR